MSDTTKCYWTKDSYCSLKNHQNEDEIFIIGSCDSNRRKFIDTIIDVVEKELKMKAIFAEDLKQHNGYKAFCSNICSPIIKSTLVIIDLSAPIKKIPCPDCDQEINELQQSVNVYWEYGYSCGLAKRTLLLIEESQIDKLPFDVADTQVQTYNINNLKKLLKELIEIKLKEPFPPIRYDFIIPPLPPFSISPGDQRVQPLINLLKYKVVDYYKEIRPEKKKIMRKLLGILGTFNPLFLEKYGKGGGIALTQFIDDYFNGRTLEQFRSCLETDSIHVEMPRKDPLIIAGDFALKAQRYIKQHPELEHILIGKLHGEFDTEIRNQKIFSQDMKFDDEFKLALKELRAHGFIKGEIYENQDCETEFIVPTQVHLTRFMEWYSLDYYFRQHFDLGD